MKGQFLPYDNVPKLFLYVCYFLFRIGVGRVTFPSKELRRGQNAFLMPKTRSYLYVFYFQLVFMETQRLVSFKL